jgi:hypothetical protein
MIDQVVGEVVYGNDADLVGGASLSRDVLLIDDVSPRLYAST